MPPVQDLYDQDFFEWTQRNAELLKQGCIDIADVPHIAEELADMGKSNQREAESFLKRLVLHLLKWQTQPSQRSSSWLASLADSRDQLESIFEQSPSLSRLASESLPKIYERAKRQAAIETGLGADAFPLECPYDFAQLVDPYFLPN